MPLAPGQAAHVRVGAGAGCPRALGWPLQSPAEELSSPGEGPGGGLAGAASPLGFCSCEQWQRLCPSWGRRGPRRLRRKPQDAPEPWRAPCLPACPPGVHPGPGEAGGPWVPSGPFPACPPTQAPGDGAPLEARSVMIRRPCVCASGAGSRQWHCVSGPRPGLHYRSRQTGGRGAARASHPGAALLAAGCAPCSSD